QVTRTMVVLYPDAPPQLLLRDAVAAAAPAVGVRLVTAEVRAVRLKANGRLRFSRASPGVASSSCRIWSPPVRPSDFRHWQRNTICLPCILTRSLQETEG